MDSEDDLPRAARPKRNAAVEQTNRASQSKTTRAQRTQPLFLDSEEDESGPNIQAESRGNAHDSESDAKNTLATTGHRTQSGRSTAKKRAAALLMDDGSDEGAFKGFGARKKARK